MENLKFNYKKCLDWINAIDDDFSISLDTGNYIPYGYGLMNLPKSTSVKEHLLEVLIEFKDKSLENNDSNFLKLISRKYEHWEAQQFRVINSINNLINMLSGVEKEKMEESKDKHMKFCHFNYDLLKMIKSDVLNGYQYMVIEKKMKKKKQPYAKDVLEFVRVIDEKLNIYPKPTEYKDNDGKFKIIAERIKKHFDYDFTGGTLENNETKIEGYSKRVYDLLIEWKYNTEATKYKTKHNINY